MSKLLEDDEKVARIVKLSESCLPYFIGILCFLAVCLIISSCPKH